MTGPGQLPLDLGHRPALGMEDFLVAECNRAAVAWLDRWPRWPGPALVIHGPAGCGKTHLAHVWQAESGAVSIVPGDLAAASPPALMGRARAGVIEGADAGLTDAGERGLLHLYNWLAEAGGHLLLTGACAPARWPLRLPDLASRLGAAPAVAVGPPDDALLAAVLVKQFADRQLPVGEEVVTYLLPRMERSFDAVRRLVAALDRAALAARRPVTVPLVREVLAREGA